MCVTATVGQSTTTYVVESINDITPGWMSLGFGTKMANADMVVMWVTNGNVTLSQRTAAGHVQPTVTSSPAQVASLVTPQATVSSDKPVVTFTVPNAEGDALYKQNLVWAMSTQAPSGSDASATIAFHDAGFGAFTLDVPQDSTSSSASASGSTATSTSSAPASSSTTAGSTVVGTTGGSTCVGTPQVMCISATVNSSTTLYSVTSTTSTTPGWVSLGFGQVMKDAPMVMLWKSSNGSIVLSQRTASGHVKPTPVAQPPRTAAIAAAESSPLASQPIFAFSIPTSGDASSQQLIWAASSTNPGDSADADVAFHDLGFGAISLDASAAVSSNGTPTASSSSSQPPLNGWQKLIVVHAVLFVVGFLVLLPFGALVARLLRTSVPWWFKVHWIVQFYITFPVMVVAFATSVAAVHQRGGEHFNDWHKRVGLALFVLYFAQCAFGAVVHFVKSPNRVRRPAQNYLHAIVGLVTIGLAIAQVRNGYSHEWPTSTGRGSVGRGVNVLWIVWVVALPVLYFGGLVLLPRQYRQERDARDLQEKRAYNGSESS